MLKCTVNGIVSFVRTLPLETCALVFLLGSILIDISTSAHPPVTPIAYTKHLLGLCIGVILLAFVRALRGKLTGRVGLVFLAWMAGLLFKILSTIFSDHPWDGLWGSYPSWTDGVYFSSILLVTLFIFGGKDWSNKKLRRFSDALLAQAFLLSAITLYESINSGVPIANYRAWSPLANSDNFISYALLVLPFSAGMFLRAIKVRERRSLLALYGINTIVISLALFVCLPLSIQQVLNRVSQKSDNNITNEIIFNGSNSERVSMWRMGWQIGRDHPILGVGPGNVASASWNYPNFSEGNAEAANVNRVHSEIIESFTQGGIPGLSWYLLFWLTAVYFFIKHIKKTNGVDKIVYISMLAGVIAYVLFNQLFYTTPLAGIIAFIFLAIGTKDGGASIVSSDQNARLRIVVTFGAVSLFSLMLILGWNNYTGRMEAENSLEIAEKEQYTNRPVAEQSISHLMNVYSHDPLYYYQASRFYATFAYDTRRLDVYNHVYKEGITSDNQLAYIKKSLQAASQAVSMDGQSGFYRLNYLLLEIRSSSVDPNIDTKEILRQIEAQFANAPYNWKITFYKTIIRNYRAVSEKPGIEDSKRCIINLIPEDRRKEFLYSTSANYE